MAKVIPVALQSMIASQYATLASCLDVTLVDSRVFGFTGHDKDLVISGVTYKADSGFLGSSLEWQADLSLSNMEMMGFLSSDAILESELRAGLWDYAKIRVFYVNWANLSNGTIKQARGYLGEVRTGKKSFTAEVFGLMWALQQTVGRVVDPGCDAMLGDSRCTIDLGPFTVTGSLTGVTSRRVFADSALTNPDDYFQEGIVTMTSGPNDGISREVKSYVESGGALQVYQPFPYDLSIADTYSMVPGCLKRFQEDCVTKFDNALNFQGFPDVPMGDKIMSGRS